MQRIDGRHYFTFQVCDLRKHMVVEAHVRCYAIRHALGERGHACADSVIAEAEDILWACREAARDGGADDVTAVALEKSLEETRRFYLAEEADDDGGKFT